MAEQKYKYHELCLLFPPCTETELGELCKDIENNGLLTPIVLYEGKILDGRNRTMACLACGVEPRYKQYSGDNPLSFVISKNMNRRHLSESQRAMIAAKISAYESITQKQAAESFNVSERSVRDALKVRGQASSETVDAVERGDKTVHAAVKELKQSQLDKDQESPVETDEEAKVKLLRRSILRNATVIRRDMDLMFQITKWSSDYRDVYQQVQRIIFED